MSDTSKWKVITADTLIRGSGVQWHCECCNFRSSNRGGWRSHVVSATHIRRANIYNFYGPTQLVLPGARVPPAGVPPAPAAAVGGDGKAAVMAADGGAAAPANLGLNERGPAHIGAAAHGQPVVAPQPLLPTRPLEYCSGIAANGTPCDCRMTRAELPLGVYTPALDCRSCGHKIGFHFGGVLMAPASAINAYGAAPLALAPPVQEASGVAPVVSPQRVEAGSPIRPAQGLVPDGAHGGGPSAPLHSRPAAVMPAAVARVSLPPDAVAPAAVPAAAASANLPPPPVNLPPPPANVPPFGGDSEILINPMEDLETARAKRTYLDARLERKRAKAAAQRKEDAIAGDVPSREPKTAVKMLMYPKDEALITRFLSYSETLLQQPRSTREQVCHN